MILDIKKYSAKDFYKECAIRGYEWVDVRFYADKYNVKVSESAYVNFILRNHKIYKTEADKQ